jgi:zinc transport system permease protein
MLEFLTYPPVLRGFIALMVAGFTFPITGVYILRKNLLPLRFMLMHGALLGGAIALALNIEPFYTTLLINILLIWIMVQTTRTFKSDTGHISLFMMVAAVGLAFVIISKLGLQSKDVMSLLWGSWFTLTPFNLVGFIALAAVVLGFQLYFNRSLRALFFDQSIAISSGVNERMLTNSMVLLTALTVAVAMKAIGALLIDVLIIVPAIVATLHSKSYRGVILWASLWGGIFTISGFFISLWLEIPNSSAVALVAVLVFLFLFILKRLKK